MCETDVPIFIEDKVFATGVVEILFNLGADGPQKLTNGKLTTAPCVQLWGQTIEPFNFVTSGKHTMLGVRFFPHTAACFFDEPVETFNGQVLDFIDVAGKDGWLLYRQLRDESILAKRIELLEAFLLTRQSRYAHRFSKLAMINTVMVELNKEDFFENINSVAARYGLSSRYLQKLFVKYCGLSPNLFSKITRFQKSLQLVAKQNLPLTAIAYECGYFDQSHFIKDFKYFTGIVPSHFTSESSSDFAASHIS